MIEINGIPLKVIDFHVHPPSLFPDEKYKNHLSEEEELLERMNEAGVDKIVLLATDIRVEDWEKYCRHNHLTPQDVPALYEWYYRIRGIFERRVSNEMVKTFVDFYPERIIGFGSVNPNEEEQEIIKELEKIKKFGFKGVKLLPTLQFFNPMEERMDIIYNEARRLGLTILFHTGCDPGPWESPNFSENANPKYIGEVARRYPDLKIVCAHMGSYSLYSPGIWFEEMIKVLKHENVYADCSSVFDQKLIREAALMFPNKIIYGSDYPCISGYCCRNTGMSRPLAQIIDMDINIGLKEKILSKNAEELLNI
jgi:predicted TIM-barrel fold metal-dependent hydrolase